MKNLFSIVFGLFITVSVIGQGTFTFSPEKPKAGEEITITYQPTAVVPVKIYGNQLFNSRLEDLDFKAVRKDGKYTATFKTDTAAVFVYFSVTTGGVLDNNNGEGFWILLYDGDKPRRNANVYLSIFYQYYGEQVGVELDKKKALTAFENEIKLYPDNTNAKLSYLRLMMSDDKELGNIKLQEEIANAKAENLGTEEDYNYLSQLYNLGKLRDESAALNEEKKAKFPNGKWIASEALNKFYAEKDLTKKKELYEGLVADISSKDNFSHLQKSIPNLQSTLLRAYVGAKDWSTFDTALNEFNIENQQTLSSLYNNAAWGMYEANEELELAEKYAKAATDFTKGEWETSKEKKRNPKKIEQAAGTYAMYADTYAAVLYKLEKYQQGYALAKEAALDINEGKQIDLNGTYVMLAQKVLPENELKTALEKFVIDGKSTGEMKNTLKDIYSKEKGSEAGFEEYLSNLEAEAKRKMREELEKKMENKEAPTFSLVNLDGTKVDLKDLKGKVVIVDFWATWCGPCIASFPGMKATQEKYKDNPNVKFVFINAWENGENKQEAVAEFIKKGNYPFDVLFDLDNKVIGSYGVNGIPTKFIIDGDGNIRFKSMGFSGSADKLVTELSMMIEMASGK